MKHHGNDIDRKEKARVKALVDAVEGLPQLEDLRRMLRQLPDGGDVLSYLSQLDICRHCGSPQPNDHYLRCQRDD